MTTKTDHAHGRKQADADTRFDRAKHTTAQTIDAAPLAVLAGGIAVGALAGALIPRSQKEKDLLAPVGRELSQRASAAVAAARDTGKEEFSELGLTKRAAKGQAKSLLEGVTQALTNAGAAAAKSATTKP